MDVLGGWSDDNDVADVSSKVRCRLPLDTTMHADETCTLCPENELILAKHSATG